ncbi:MAG: 3-oxoacyl-[acyl-carrier-protein] synthase III C-terminal domain-containing protein [Myxococcota bacterium]|jgi:3-hydroxy-3-methylglutaryl CoA synthase
MIGIVSYGGYIPRLRMSRMSICEQMGWFAPAIMAVAQGERAFCNWDEDALTMAVAASRDCLAGVDKAGIDAVWLCSTTMPFADRLNAGILKTALNLRDDIGALDCAGSIRCGTTGLLNALDVVSSGARKQIMVTASDMRETKAAYFYEMWFGDGAASVLLGADNLIAEYKGGFSVTHDFVDHYRGAQSRYDYMWEERWVRDEGFAKIVPQAVNGLFKKLGITMNDVDTFVFPCLFKAEQRSIAKALGAGKDKLMDNMHEQCGETGAAHPLVMLASALDNAKPGDRILVVGFGQGADALYFRVTDNITKMAARRGIKGSLLNRKPVESYTRFLKFRDLIKTEMGIRAEVPMQTDMTVLWRNRKMLTGLVGGKCTKCGTPQFPKMDICVNPKCLAVGAQEDYEFAEREALIKTYTADMLAVSVEPPTLYGLVQFVGGGRFMADFADCELTDVHVGQRVRFSFRRKYTDSSRGFTEYFWKAVPVSEG